MNQQREITPSIAVADQPTEADLAALKGAGFVGVVNLRHDGEPEQPMDTAAEGERVRALGMDYLHVGIGAAPITEQDVTSVSHFLDKHAPDKVLVHCRKGGRAAALVLLHQALAQGWSPAEAITKGKAMGLEVDGALRTKVENYLFDHQGNP